MYVFDKTLSATRLILIYYWFDKLYYNNSFFALIILIKIKKNYSVSDTWLFFYSFFRHHQTTFHKTKLKTFGTES